MVKLNTPKRLKADFRIITPMFIGDGQKDATMVYPQSFKGALRFWWRALMWAEYYNQTQDDVKALRALHEAEELLFGGVAEKSKKAKEALFTLRINGEKVGNAQQEASWPPSGNNPSGYLGMGLWGDNKNSHRKGFPKLNSKYSFQVILTLAATMLPEQKEQLRNALQLLGLFGGLGSRARRGFGSIQLEKIDDVPFEAFDSQQCYQSTVESRLASVSDTPLAPYTALNKDAALAICGGFRSAEAAHADLGSLYKNYRGQPSELRGDKKKVFGLPLTGVDEKLRRASPLFFHIYQLNNQEFGYIALYLPAAIFHFDNKHQKVDWSLAKSFIKQVEER